jgi:hypothetical protein
VEAAYGTWQSVKCSAGKSPQLLVKAYPESNCDLVGFKPEGPNRNLWVFREDDWYLNESVSEAIAITSLTVDKSKGIILDADVELNAHAYDFTLGATSVETDLEGVVLHEAGHVLGLGHSDWATSTMASDDEEGSVDARSLEADDIRAVCALLPQGATEKQCDSEPVGGFATECEAPEGCCSVAVGRKTTLGPCGILGVILALLLRRSYAKVAPSQPHK